MSARRRTGLPFTDDDDVAERSRARIDAAKARARGGRTLHRAHHHQPVDAHAGGHALVADEDADAGRRHRALRMSWGTMRFTTSTGMAKPMPADAPEGE